MKSKIAVYAAPVLLAVSAAPAFGQVAITTPILASVSNFRDIAGVAVADGGSGLAYTTTNDGTMRTGVFYRSNALSGLTATDKATLSTLGITEDIDLRTPGEISGAPEVQNLPAGMAYVQVNIFGSSGPPIPSLASSAAAESYLEQMNQGFVTNAVDRENFATVFADLANGTGPMMYNCSSGKDRTGWTSAILESIAGMSSADIMANYLATNAYSAASINAVAAISPAYGTILGVQAPDLQAGLDQIITSYGSLDNYLIEGLGMSQAEIYVLRAKMVDYAMLPGQAGFTGNAAAGAALLNALQNSPLSGSFTAYNYYLQSSIDAGNLGGVQDQIGGQVVADTESYLTRLPQLTNNAIAPYINGIGMNAGQTTIWEANLAGVMSTDSNSNVADANSHSAGLMIGATHRIGDQISVDAGVGYNWGTLTAAEGNSQANTVLTTAGIRYGLSSLDSGPYVSGGANADIVSVHDNRNLGGGLGQAIGNTNGAVYDGHAEIGSVIPQGDVTFTPQLGIDVAYASLRGFTEQGSALALSYRAMNDTVPSMIASVQITPAPKQAGNWSIAPAVTLGYQRLLSSPVVSSHGAIYGNSISQISAFNSRDLGTLALNVAAQRGPLGISAGITGLIGDANNSTGASGNLTISYKF